MTPSNSPPIVRIVLLNFNGGDTVVEAVEAATLTRWPAERLEIVCVDNGSQDGSIERIEKEFPDVRIIRNRSNRGFPGNNEALVDLSGVDFVALVNSDAFVEPGWLEPLVARARTDSDIGAVCPKILFADRFIEAIFQVRVANVSSTPPVRLRGVRVSGVDAMARSHVAAGGGRAADRSGIFEWVSDESRLRVPSPDLASADSNVELTVELEARVRCTIGLGDSSTTVREFSAGEQGSITFTVPNVGMEILNNVGSWLDDSWRGHERGLYQPDRGQFDGSCEVGTWCGAAVLLRPSYLNDVGLFEDSFFLYYEDTDLAVRGKERGWRFVTEPSSRVRHLHSASTIEGSAVAAHYIERNRLLLLLRHAPIKVAVGEFIRFVVITGSYARRALLDTTVNRSRLDLQVVRRRSGSLLAALWRLPSEFSSRRRFATRRLIPSEDLQATLAFGSDGTTLGPKGDGVPSTG